MKEDYNIEDFNNFLYKKIELMFDFVIINNHNSLILLNYFNFLLFFKNFKKLSEVNLYYIYYKFLFILRKLFYIDIILIGLQ